RRPGIIAMISLPTIQRLLEVGIVSGVQISDRVRRICRDVAVREVENIANLMETEPMGLQFGLLADWEPTSAFTILRARDRVSLAINPFRTGKHPGAQSGVAMITGADEAITAHQRVAEASWREAVKGPTGAMRLRQLLSVVSPVS
ncbi:MAG: transcriptional regulator, partial [Rhodopila sp.]